MEMKIIDHDKNRNRELLAKFYENDISYDRKKFCGLCSPSSTLIDKGVVDKLQNDLYAIENWVDGVLEIYGELINKKNDELLLQMLEWGLDEYACKLQRESTLLKQKPVSARLDCVCLNESNYVTEVQWKGAGEGNAAAIEDSYQSIFTIPTDQLPFNNLINSWAEFLPKDGCSVNTGKKGWMDTERYLISELKKKNICLVSIPYNEIQNCIRLEKDKLLVKSEDEWIQVKYLYLDRLSEVIDSSMLDKIIKLYNDGKIILDPPPSYIFNQKLPMCLPFMERYKSYFKDSVREVLIPTISISPEGKFDLSPLMFCMKNETLKNNINTFENIIDLPINIRKNLVIKCGSIHNWFNHGGHGVYRIDGEQNQIKEIFDHISTRIKEEKEPWVIQPYMGKKWNTPVTHISNIDEIKYMDLYAKFMIYFHLSTESESKPILKGGISTLGADWKVSGASSTPAVILEDNTYCGAFRHDIRINNK